MAIASQIKQFMEDSSWIRRMFELGIAMKQERGEENVFDLSLGNPVMEPPPEFLRQIRLLLDNLPAGSHRYMPNAGYHETRAAVAQALGTETGLPYGPEHILMTVGAGGGINTVLHALCEPGDEVVIFAPFFAEYLFYIRNHNASPVVVGCESDFTPNLHALEAAITFRTKAVILNSPNNPSGRVYEPSFINDLGNLLRQKSNEYNTELYLLSDEPYRKIIFDGLSYPFPQAIYHRTITVTSHSKDLALPGERIGYAAIHPMIDESKELMDALIFCNRVLGFVNAPALMQHAIKNLQTITVDVTDYQKKRDYLYQALTDIGYRVPKPQGAFYMFPEAPDKDELRIVDALRNHGVLVVPGRGFGMPGYFRISYCVHQEVLENAVAGFSAAARELGMRRT